MNHGDSLRFIALLINERPKKTLSSIRARFSLNKFLIVRLFLLIIRLIEEFDSRMQILILGFPRKYVAAIYGVPL